MLAEGDAPPQEESSTLVPALPPSLSALLVDGAGCKHMQAIAKAAKTTEDVEEKKRVNEFFDLSMGPLPRPCLPPMAEAKLLQASRKAAMTLVLSTGAGIYFWHRAWASSIMASLVRFSL